MFTINTLNRLYGTFQTMDEAVNYAIYDAGLQHNEFTIRIVRHAADLHVDFPSRAHDIERTP
jgi:hypothetical protein